MKVLLTGSTGQLGISIIKTKPEYINLIITNRSQLDLTNTYNCQEFILSEKPDWIINCAGFTAVDQAEKEIELSNKINGYAPQAFANAINKINGNLLQISTDYVFDGEQNYPYRIDQQRNPINQYGYSKALGEELIQKNIDNIHNTKILRTSWLISPFAKNFVVTMLKLHEKKETLKVVCDQIGCPTSAKHLAYACWEIINYKNKEKLPQILHWSDSGIASWYDLALAVGEMGMKLGILERMAHVYPIKTIDYPSLAKRPKYSILETQKTSELLGIKPNHWRKNLLEILIEYKNKYK